MLSNALFVSDKWFGCVHREQEIYVDMDTNTVMSFDRLACS